MDARDGEHEIHHRGQIYIYLALLEVPTPPLYGLTSDAGCGAQPDKEDLGQNTTKPGWLARLFFAWNWSGSSRF
jgi:hypothetical protein